MKKSSKFLTPSYGWSFFGGFLSASIFYIVLYSGAYYFQWPVTRLLGVIPPKISFDISIYFAMYVLFFWGIFVIIQKNGLVKHENLAILKLQKIWQSHTIISKRAELDNFRATMSHGDSTFHIRNTALVQTLLFLIEHCLVTQTSQRVMELFSRRMTTLQNHAESSYHLLRYIAWGIPSLGFIGTVMGIGQALSYAGQAIENIDLIVQPLGVAFDTTFIALSESLILMFFIYYMQNKEESLINEIDLFCQENFIINLRIEEGKA